MTIRSLRHEDVDGTTVLFVERMKKVLAFTAVTFFGVTYEVGDLYPTIVTERVTCPRKQLAVMGEYQMQLAA